MRRKIIFVLPSAAFALSTLTAGAGITGSDPRPPCEGGCPCAFATPKCPPINQPAPSIRSYLANHENQAFIAADFTARIMDAYSTRKNLTNPCHCFYETQIGPIADTTTGMYAYSLGIATGVEIGAYELWKHGHPRIARAVQGIEIVGTSSAVIHNLSY